MRARRPLKTKMPHSLRRQGRSGVPRPIHFRSQPMFVLPLARPASLVRRSAASPAFGSALDRLFDESFDRFFGGSTAGADTRTPAMDVSESDAAYTIVFDVPG